jgi:hypothetical protein
MLAICMLREEIHARLRDQETFQKCREWRRWHLPDASSVAGCALTAYVQASQMTQPVLKLRLPRFPPCTLNPTKKWFQQKNSEVVRCTHDHGV